MVVLVRAKRNPLHLIFPKGHIEPGETAEVAALRELREEAGVHGEIVTRVGERSYSREGQLYAVTYFLVRFLTFIDHGEEGRDPTWYTASDAADRLSFSDGRTLLEASLPYLL